MFPAEEKTPDGFTLIELSIVIVLISLILVLTTSGRDIIRASNLHSTIVRMQNFEYAINAYSSKYDSWPGDHKDAYDYFDGSGGSLICGMNDSVPFGCNGDGNGRIDDDGEDFRVWQHLTLAKMISEDLTGVTSGIPSHVLGVNMPRSPLSSGGFWIHRNTVYGKTANGAILASEGSDKLDKGILPPHEAQALDKKMDDGNADSGKIFSFDGNGDNNCAGKWNDSSGTYSLNNNKNVCRVVFWLD